ncbi:peptidase U32 family protein [Desulfolucanica intricata]|uniref:peptidase U32 family protein n=1 Tax=Desulfolucanica intricata TaxID=1285191 RepID=UPI00083442B1|nr:U32 family peptidase [Desulfolucanica intricata]
MTRPELLAPAGDLEKLKVAIIYGADAVYVGGKNFGLRAGAGNLSIDEIREGVKFAHSQGAKVYVTVNIFAHNQDFKELPEYLTALQEINVDAVIVSDPGVFTLVREISPNIPIHISTQANTTNWVSARFWSRLGAERIVLARELNIEEIKEINERVKIDIECFIHGAMCISYSGRCLLSNYFTGRDANRGDCAQACRWRYALVEEKRPGHYLPIIEEDRGTYILSSLDLCLIEYIPQLVQAGVKSFKIEGRMKSVHYVASVVKAYREAIDSYINSPENYKFNARWLEDIAKVSNRDYTTGFLFGKPEQSAHYAGEIYKRQYSFVGVVRGYDQDKKMAVVEQRNRFFVGDELEVFLPRAESYQFRIPAMYNEVGKEISSAPHPQQILYIPFDEVPPYTMLRKPVI